MRKKVVFWFCCAVIFLSGCSTLKGLGVGLSEGISRTAAGVKEDSRNLWQTILKADNWVKENMW